MLKIDKNRLDALESDYPGIKKMILRFENAVLPDCAHCSSADTAQVQCGIVGRVLTIAAATTKIKLIPNRPPAGKCFCNSCNEFFD